MVHSEISTKYQSILSFRVNLLMQDAFLAVRVRVAFDPPCLSAKNENMPKDQSI